MNALLHSLRHGGARRFWAPLAALLIRLGGPRLAAWLTFQSMDWGDLRHGRAILCLSRESFVKDITELRQRSGWDYPMVMAGFTRFQMAWFPASMQMQTFYQKEMATHPEAIAKSAAYARALIAMVQRRCSVRAVMSANFDYWQDSGFKQACRELGLPFLVLSREHPIIPRICEEVVQWYHKAEYQFDGTAIAVAGPSTQRVLLAAGVLNRPEQVEIIGLPRYDAWLDVDTTRPLADRPLITLLTFTEGYMADASFREVLRLFCEAACRHAGQGVDFVVKSKDAHDTELVRSLMGTEGQAVARCTHELPLFEVLPRSRLVINYNSLSLVEAVMAHAQTVIPAWGECRATGPEAMYPADEPVVSRVVRFADTPAALADTIAQAVAGQIPPVPGAGQREFVNRYLFVPESGSCSQAFDAFLARHVG